MDKNSLKKESKGTGTATPRHEQKPEDRKPGPTRENVGKEKRSDLADVGEAAEQGGRKASTQVPGAKVPGGSRGLHADKESLEEAEMRRDRKAIDRGPGEHADAPVRHTGAQPGDRKSAGSRDQATHTDRDRHGERRDGV